MSEKRFSLWRSSQLQQTPLTQPPFLKRTFVTDVVQEQQQQPLLHHSLPPKTPKDSFIEKILRFSTDKRLRDCYINHFGHLRVGLVLEDLDRMAAAIAYKHVLGESKEIAANRLEGNQRLYTSINIKCKLHLLMKNSFEYL